MKLLVTDIDGTIAFGDNKIPEKIEDSLNAFQKEGNLLMIATGRNYAQAQVLLNNTSVKFDFLALCNGAIIYDNTKNKIIMENHIEKDYGELVAVFNNSYRIDSFDKTYATKKYNKTKLLSFMNRAKLKKESYSRVEFLPIEELNAEDKIYTISAKSKNEKHLKELVKHLEKYKLDFEILINNLDIDFQAKGTDKSKAINNIKENYNLNEKDIFPIGDSLNDYLMIKEFDNSATFDYGHEKLKENAKYIVKDVEEYINIIKNNQ